MQSSSRAFMIAKAKIGSSSENLEDLRQLSIWAQVGAFKMYTDDTATKKISAILKKYPEAETELKLFVVTRANGFARDVKTGHFTDGTGLKFLTECLATFGEVMP